MLPRQTLPLVRAGEINAHCGQPGCPIHREYCPFDIPSMKFPNHTSSSPPCIRQIAQTVVYLLVWLVHNVFSGHRLIKRSWSASGRGIIAFWSSPELGQRRRHRLSTPSKGALGAKGKVQGLSKRYLPTISRAWINLLPDRSTDSEQITTQPIAIPGCVIAALWLRTGIMRFPTNINYPVMSNPPLSTATTRKTSRSNHGAQRGSP